MSDKWLVDIYLIILVCFVSHIYNIVHSTALLQNVAGLTPF